MMDQFKVWRADGCTYLVLVDGADSFAPCGVVLRVLAIRSTVSEGQIVRALG